MSEGILVFAGKMPRPKPEVQAVPQDSIFTIWAHRIAENAADMPNISIIKAKAAFDEWRIDYPKGLADEIQKRGRL